MRPNVRSVVLLAVLALLVGLLIGHLLMPLDLVRP